MNKNIKRNIIIRNIKICEKCSNCTIFTKEKLFKEYKEKKIVLKHPLEDWELLKIYLDSGSVEY